MVERAVSDEAFESVLKDGGLINREKHRAIQRFDRRQMERYIASIYRSGFEDGCNAVQKAVADEAAAKHTNPEDEYEEVKADWDDVLRIIGSVKGMSGEMLKSIDERLREVMG